MKSKRLLYSFISYCEHNPSQRFWQALTNWSKFKFIYGSFDEIGEITDSSELRDVFYMEGN